MEGLTPDFQGRKDCIARVARSGLEVYAHNIETVRELHWSVAEGEKRGVRCTAYSSYSRDIRKSWLDYPFPHLLTKSTKSLGPYFTPAIVRVFRMIGGTASLLTKSTLTRGIYIYS